MLFLVALVAIPFLIRSVFNLAFTAGGNLDNLVITLSAYAAQDFITGAAHVVTYLGVVLVVAAIAKIGPTPGAAPTTQPGPQAPPMMAQQGGFPQGQQPYYAPQYNQQQQQYGVPPQQQYGQEIKAYDGTSPPPQAYYPPPQQNGMPPQNGVPPQGYMPQQQQQYSPPPQQQYQPPPQQPGLMPQQQPVQNVSPVSSASPQNPTAPHPQQQGSELPSTHY